MTRKHRVLDACSVSQAHGVEPGQKERLAKALVERANVIEWKHEEFAEASERWLDRLIPFASVIEPVDQHEAVVDLSGHPDPEHILLPMILSVQSAVPGMLRVGTGHTRWISKLTSLESVATFDIDQPSVSLKPLPVRFLLPVSQEAIERLKFLGYTTIGSVQDIPWKVLRNQFGLEAQVISKACRGGFHQPVESKYPPASIRSQLTFEGVADSEEVIIRSLGELAQRLAFQLSAGDLQGTEMKAVLEFDEGAPEVRARTFAKPLYSRSTCHAALTALFKPMPEKGMVSLTVVMPNLRKQAFQQEAFGERGRQQSSSESSIDRLNVLFGEGTIRSASNVKPQWHHYARSIWERSLGHG